MKLDIQAFNLVVNSPKYEGYDAYLLNDDKTQVPYHINMFIVESGNVCCMIAEKMPVNKETPVYELFEFNGNKLLEHKVVRLKEVDNKSVKYQKFVDKYKNHEFQFQTK